MIELLSNSLFNRSYLEEENNESETNSCGSE